MTYRSDSLANEKQCFAERGQRELVRFIEPESVYHYGRKCKERWDINVKTKRSSYFRPGCY